MFEACLAVPACTGITTWGVGDADTWLDDGPWPWRWNRPNGPLLFDVAYAPKPAHSAVCKALLGDTIPRIGYGPRRDIDASSSNVADSLGDARMMPGSGEPR